jgi:hypothetical protein
MELGLRPTYSPSRAGDLHGGQHRSQTDTRGEPMAALDDLSSQRFYHGTKADLKPGDLQRQP